MERLRTLDVRCPVSDVRCIVVGAKGIGEEDGRREWLRCPMSDVRCPAPDGGLRSVSGFDTSGPLGTLGTYS